MTKLIPCGAALEDVRFRPYGWRDAERLSAMSELLTSQSLYRRFFSGTPVIPGPYVRRLDTMDHWDHDAIVALAGDEMIGIAEYARDGKDRSRAEVSVLVADCWQHRGLGGLLIAYLAELAGRRGIVSFDADVLLENRPGVLAVQSVWPAAKPAYADGAAHYRLPVAVPAADSFTQSAQAG